MWRDVAAISRLIPRYPALGQKFFCYWVAASSAVGGARWGTDPAPREGAENREAVANNQDGEPRDPAVAGWQAVDESDSYFRDHFSVLRAAASRLRTDPAKRQGTKNNRWCARPPA